MDAALFRQNTFGSTFKCAVIFGSLAHVDIHLMPPCECNTQIYPFCCPNT
jgi:hypothetical protein